MLHTVLGPCESLTSPGSTLALEQVGLGPHKGSGSRDVEQHYHGTFDMVPDLPSGE